MLGKSKAYKCVLPVFEKKEKQTKKKNKNKDESIQKNKLQFKYTNYLLVHDKKNCTDNYSNVSIYVKLKAV